MSASLELGRELRRLRLARGLSQRALTRMLGLSAHSNIADYESGRRIPPRDIIVECERLLGANTLAPLHTYALSERANASAIGAGARFRRGHLFLLAAAVAVLSVGLLAWSRWSVEPAAGRASISDGSDPKATRCDDDAVPIDAEPVRLAEPRPLQVGTVVLRYSPRCTASWAVFEPLPMSHKPSGIVVIVKAVRPGDSTRTAVHHPGFDHVSGDLLRAGSGCVRAKVIVTFADGRRATGATACLSV